jgi:drug/metabolite transporter (DMT)-like permease
MEQASSRQGGNGRFKLVQGLVSGTLLSAPLWVCIGVAVAVVLQDGPITRLQSAILFLAAAIELVLLRRTWRAIKPPARSRASAPQPRAFVAAVGLSRPKPLLLLLGVVGTYLHYYFWDIQLQIASMPSVTVFVHAPALG